MFRMSLYRPVAVALGCLFCIFSVGVPVVLASCPMMSGSSAALSCCPDAADRSHPSIAPYKNTSCCETKIAASRNTQEFVQRNADLSELAASALAPLVSLPGDPMPHLIPASPAAFFDTSPPTSPVAFPILFSSLLI